MPVPHSETSPVSLGIDLGTSELKAVLLDLNGAVLAQAGAALSISRPRPGWSEQNPQDWWTACGDALGRLQRLHADAYGRIACIGLSGQMHGAVLLDRHDRVIRPAILWNDSRALAEAAALAQAWPAHASVIGSLPMAGLTAPKLLWLRTHEPESFAAIGCVLSPKDYLRLALTGERVTDPSDASGTLWLDVRQRVWFEPMVEACGLRLGQLPRLVEGSAAAGRVSAPAAAQLGLGEHVVVAGGGGDNPVSAVGIGAVDAGQSFVSLGTSAAVVTITDSMRGNPATAVHAFCHAVPQRWYTMGAMLSGASCLRWLTRLLGQPDESALLQIVESSVSPESAAAATAPMFLPYLAGERTPHNDPLARGAFVNLGHDTTPAMLGHAVLEGVAFGLRDAMLALESAGARVSGCSLVGGGSRSPYWAQCLADVLGRKLHTLAGSELGASIGAAKLGFLASGAGDGLLRQGLPVKQVFVPRPEYRDALDRRHAHFRALFPAVRGLHQGV